VKSTEAEILKSVQLIISDVAGLPLDAVAPDQRFMEDLGLDSLTMIEVVVQAQRDFGVVIPDSRLRELSTVADVVRYIAKESATTGGLSR
jgi:acyl carrier protein